MFDWISHNRDLFLVNYTEVGTTHQFAVELENEHSQFATSAVVRFTLNLHSLHSIYTFHTSDIFAIERCSP